jgi:ubiquinone biosynthesis monooxygenase Coq7
MTGLRRLPGDPGRDQLVARMIRVDQAGEYGAKRIYDGQLAVLRLLGASKGEAAAAIRRMAEQEQRHLDVFDRLMPERRVRPTALSPLWHVAGFALGAATALLGERAAMACTVAVEEVIDEHYRRQSETLGEAEPALKAAIDEFRGDEREHRDVALAHGAEAAPGYASLTAAIKAGSRLAIWLSTRI